MTSREPLCCPRCGGRVAVVEMLEAFLDWGPAVVGEDGVVRPASWNDPPVVMADNSTTTGAYAHCDRPTCGHRWRLRRRFDATPDAWEAPRG